MIKINAVKNLSGYEFNAMKFGNPIRENKVSRFYVYCGRPWNNRHGRSLKGSPLQNLYKPSKEVSVKECIKLYENKIRIAPLRAEKVDKCGATYLYELGYVSMRNELDRILSLCSQYDIVVLVCHCPKKEDDEEVQCHTKIIRSQLEERMGT